MPQNPQAYLDLRQTPLHELSPAERIAFCTAVADWLGHDEAWIRDDAAERLATAVLWERYWEDQPDLPPPSHYIERLEWLLDTIETANQLYLDVLPSFIRHLRYHTPSNQQLPPVLAWLERLEHQPPSGLDFNLVIGVRILLEPPALDWSEQAAAWIALLDHPSNWVRGCAAMMLGNWSEDDTAPSRPDLFALIGEKELARPGIAGPFWSPSHAGGDWANAEWASTVTPWMMDLLERRNGPPPPFEDMPANDIEFFLHELCSLSPEMVDRMLAGGFTALALMTATEIRGFVEGMRPRLETLAHNADSQIAAAASSHLEHYYAS